MFSKSESLPVHGGNNRFNNGVSNIPVVNKNVRNLLTTLPTLIVGAAFLAVALSIASVAISLLIIVSGILHCRSNAFTHSLKCSEIECTLIKSSINESVNFRREDLLDAATVRIDKAGTVVSDKLVRESQKSRTFGFSVRVKFRSAAVETAEAGSSIKHTNKEVLISTQDMGRRKSRMWAADIEKYIHYRPDSEADTSKKTQRNRHKVISLEFSKSVTFLGLMLVMFGTASCIAACYFGQWSEKTRRGRVKKAY